MHSKDEEVIRKELVLVRTAFERHIEDDKREFGAIKASIQVNTDRIKTIDENVQELLDIIKALSLGKRMVIGASIFVGSVVALALGLRSILGWFR